MTLNVANLDRLISHLEGLPENRFNMSIFVETQWCGTVGCIAGHAHELFGDFEAVFGNRDGLFIKNLFMPSGYSNDRQGNKAYPLPRAIRTLKHMRSEFLRTGEVVVDWDAPEPVEKPAWAAPKAVERVLPEEIVSLLRPAQRSEVSA